MAMTVLGLTFPWLIVLASSAFLALLVGSLGIWVIRENEYGEAAVQRRAVLFDRQKGGQVLFWMAFVVVAVLVSIPFSGLIFDLLNAPDNRKVAAGMFLGFLLLLGWGGIMANITNVVRKNARKFVVIVALIAGGMSSSGCARTVVGPGHVGIKVNYYGQDKGVESFPRVTGVIWYNPISEDVLQYPTYVQNAVWTHSVDEGNPVNEEITFTNADQMQIAADISLAYQLQAEKVPAFYVKFRSEDLRTFTHGFLRNLAREKFDSIAGRYKIEQIMGNNAPFLKEVRDTLQHDLDPIGVRLEQFGFIGAPRPPLQVVDAINAKVKATQDAVRVENELRSIQAEARKAIAEAEGAASAAIAKAQGDAKANEILSSSINERLIEWRRLDIQQQSISKWNGALPTFSGGALPFVQIPGPVK
jgi:regulator of protease activity HflC (stomatin/prohibitin superfamily)